MTGEKALRRFHRWQERVPARTSELGGLVERELVPVIVSHGFRLVDVWLQHTEQPTEPRELLFERPAGSLIDSISISFDKYDRPRFQVRSARRESVSPHTFVRACNLVARRSQYYHFWGKPFLLPSLLWPKWAAVLTVATIGKRISQLFDFLETGARGRNISKPVGAIAPTLQEAS